jgi:outer membrane protein
MILKNCRRLATAAALCILLLIPARARALETVKAGKHLTLSRATEITLRNHPRGLEMRAVAAAAQQRVQEASALLLPQVYGASEYLRSTDNPIGNTTYLNPGFVPRITGTLHGEPASAAQSFSLDTTDNYLGGVAIRQFLFDFGRVRGFVTQRKEEARAAEARYQLERLDLVFTATKRYFALLAAQQKIIVFKKAVEQRTEQLHAADVKAKAGLTSQIDVLTAQAALARARTELLDAHNQAATARVALDAIMALGPQAPPYELADILSYQPMTVPERSLLSAAIELRPDLQMLEAEVRAAGAQIVQARSDYFPTVSATAGYNTMGTGLPATNNFDAGIMVTWPIFNGFQTEHEVEEARLRRRAAEEAVRDLELQIDLQVKSAYLDLQTSLQRIHESEATLAASAGQLELAAKRYNAGLGSIIELTDAERFYSQDDASYVDALYRYSVDSAALRRATAQSLAGR